MFVLPKCHSRLFKNASNKLKYWKTIFFFVRARLDQEELFRRQAVNRPKLLFFGFSEGRKIDNLQLGRKCYCCCSCRTFKFDLRKFHSFVYDSILILLSSTKTVISISYIVHYIENNSVDREDRISWHCFIYMTKHTLNSTQSVKSFWKVSQANVIAVSCSAWVCRVIVLAKVLRAQVARSRRCQ